MILIGVADLNTQVSYNPIQLIYGKSIKGTYFGGNIYYETKQMMMTITLCLGWKSRDQVPKLVDEYLSKELKVDEFISHTFPIESINEAIELVENGEW